MRLTGVLIVILLGGALALGAATTGERPAAPPPPVQATISQLGLEGIRELYVQIDLIGDEKFLNLVGTSREKLRAQVEERLKRIPGLSLLPEQSLTKPRLVLQVIGHLIPGYDEADPPTAISFMLAVSQPVVLNRPGRDGQPLVTNGLTACTNLLITRRASAARQAFDEKVAHLLNEFEQEYRRFNPTPEPR